MKFLKYLLILICSFSSLYVVAANYSSVSPNSSHFIRINEDFLELYDLKSGERIKTIEFKKLGIINEGIHGYLVLSHDGKYLLIRKQYEKKIYIVDLINEKRIKQEEVRKTCRVSYQAIPNSQNYIKYYYDCLSKTKAKLEVISFSNETFEPLQELTIKRKKEKSFGSYSIKMGKVIVGHKGKFIAVTGRNKTLKYSLADLSQNPKKLDLPNTNFVSRDFKTGISKEGIYSSGKIISKHYNGNIRKATFYISGTEQVYAYYGFYGKKNYNDFVITKFDYSINKKSNIFYRDYLQKYPPTFTPNGNIILGDSVFTLKEKKFLFVLKSDEILFKKSSKEYRAGNYLEAKKIMNNISTLETEFKVYALKVYKATQDEEGMLRLMDNNLSKLKDEEKWMVAELYARNNKFEVAYNLIEELQATDMRRHSDSLMNNLSLAGLRSQERFKNIIKYTKMMDAISDPKYVPTQSQFNSRIGLFELHRFKAYDILRNYKDIGLEQAVKEAKKHFDSSLIYTYTYPGGAANYYSIANMYFKVGQYVNASNAYESAIYFSPDSVRTEWIDAAACYVSMKQTIEEILAERKRDGIRLNKEGLYDDYKKIKNRAFRLCTDYILKYPEDPTAYYVRAKTWYSFKRGFSNKRRMKDANKTIELCKKLGYQVPEDCYEMSKEYWNQIKPIARQHPTNTNSTSKPTRCYTNCSTCKGRGIKSAESRCGSCSGSGKRGRCYACNGRGRKYYTSNIQFCMTCSGKGTLSCYMCNGTGRKHSYKNCGTCSGSGYDCK